MNEAAAPNPFEPFFDWLKAWTPMGIAAPDHLDQAILPGWSLISVNANNSAAPDTEQAVVARASYGRQLGRLIDAVEDLIGERATDAAERPSFVALHELSEEVAAAKLDAAKARIARLQSDLTLLRAQDPEEYRRQKDVLTASFG